MTTDRATLGAFLRSRRDALTPARAGIDATPGARRVPGLRKEELARLVGLSTDHYSRIEQGRQPTIGPDLLAALGRALQLDDVERQHLADLAAPVRSAGGGGARPGSGAGPQHPEAGMLRLMTSLEHVPVVLLGRRAEVLATNALLVEVLGARFAPGASFVRWLFLDPLARERIENWSDFAAAAVGGLRYESGRRPDDRRLTAVIAELRAADPDVARWWDDHAVTDRTSLTKLVRHPVGGLLRFGIETVVGPHDPDQRLVVYTVEPGSATEQAVRLLSGWASAPAPVGGGR